MYSDATRTAGIIDFSMAFEHNGRLLKLGTLKPLMRLAKVARTKINTKGWHVIFNVSYTAMLTLLMNDSSFGLPNTVIKRLH